MEQEYKLKDDYFLRVWIDDNTKSPDNFRDTEVFLVYDHRQFYIKREGFEPKDIYNYFEEKSGTIVDTDYVIDYSKYHVFTVYAYIHSGISLSLQSQGCRFDVSSTGYILVKKDILQQGAGNIEKDLTKEEAIKYAENLIKVWNIYLYSDVYGFSLIKKNKCKHCEHIEEEIIDSCGGFYKETDVGLLEEMLNHIGNDYYQKDVPINAHEMALVLLS